MPLRILLLTGIKEELTPLLNYHSFEFDKQSRLYRSIPYPDLYAGTTGPGLSRRKEVRRWLNKIQPTVVINAGLVGLLELDHPLQIGDRVALDQLVDARNHIIYPGGKGHTRLVSINKPVFAPHDKMELALDYDAHVCDMEAARLAGFLGQFDKLSEEMSLILCKVIGDRPESWDLFRYEHLVRDWQYRNIFRKAWAAIQFPGGPMALKRLLNCKRKALNALTAAVNPLLEQLIRHQEIPKNVDSIFIPH